MDIKTARWRLADYSKTIMSSDVCSAAETVLKNEIKASREVAVKNAYLETIMDIGCDYDGYESPKHLKELIDELVSYAKRAYKCDTSTVEFIGGNGKEFNILHEEIEAK